MAWQMVRPLVKGESSVSFDLDQSLSGLPTGSHKALHIIRLSNCLVASVMKAGDIQQSEKAILRKERLDLQKKCNIQLAI